MRISNIISMIQNRMNREKIYSTADYWDSKAEVHQGDAVSMWPNNNLNYYYNREQLSLLNQYLPQMEGAKVLDVGCGTGRLSRYLMRRGATVLGIDFSPKAIAIAQQQSPDGNPTYRVQSIFELDEEKAFDIVICWGSLTVACRDQSDLLNVMCRLRKALKANGQLFLLEPIHKGFLHRVLNMDIQEFCEVMNEAGFKIEAISHHHFWPMRLLLCYITWPKFITVSGYYLGEGIMNLFGHKSFGDYKAILTIPKT